ncbi:MAG: hypothetical protein AAF662_01095 [Pseudomonadota bacterium]
MSSCKDLKGSAARSVVLGIRLVGATAANREAIAEQVLGSSAVQEALKTTFFSHAAQLTDAKLRGVALDGAAAKSFLKPLQKSASPKALSALKAQQEFKAARSGLAQLKCSFQKTPVGVFVDDNKTWLIIIGAVVGAAGTVAMYRMKSGDVPAYGLATLLNNTADKIELGSATLGVKDIEFKPSDRSAKGKLTLDLSKLHSVKIKQKLEMAATVKAGSLKELTVSESVVVPLAPSLQLAGKSTVGLRENTLAFDTALVVTKSMDGGMKISVSAYNKGQLGQAHTYGVKAELAAPVNTAPVFGHGARGRVGASAQIENRRQPDSAGRSTQGSLFLGFMTSF